MWDSGHINIKRLTNFENSLINYIYSSFVNLTLRVLTVVSVKFVPYKV